MFTNFENFTYSSRENFPANECTIQNKREPDVFDSDVVYQILYIDIRFQAEKCITYARPYIYLDPDTSEVSYGWVSVNTSAVYGNVENSCQFYDEFVIGFIRADDDHVKNDVELFEQYKRTIEAQCE